MLGLKSKLEFVVNVFRNGIEKAVTDPPTLEDLVSDVRNGTRVLAYALRNAPSNAWDTLTFWRSD